MAHPLSTLHDLHDNSSTHKPIQPQPDESSLEAYLLTRHNLRMIVCSIGEKKDMHVPNGPHNTTRQAADVRKRITHILRDTDHYFKSTCLFIPTNWIKTEIDNTSATHVKLQLVDNARLLAAYPTLYNKTVITNKTSRIHNPVMSTANLEEKIDYIKTNIDAAISRTHPEDKDATMQITTCLHIITTNNKDGTKEITHMAISMDLLRAFSDVFPFSPDRFIVDMSIDLAGADLSRECIYKQCVLHIDNLRDTAPDSTHTTAEVSSRIFLYASLTNDADQTILSISDNDALYINATCIDAVNIVQHMVGITDFADFYAAPADRPPSYDIPQHVRTICLSYIVAAVYSHISSKKAFSSALRYVARSFQVHHTNTILSAVAAVRGELAPYVPYLQHAHKRIRRESRLPVP